MGDSLRIGDKVFIVAGITNDTMLTLDAAHPTGALNATAYTDSDLLSVETGAEVNALLVDRTGNVGIGATTPTVKLDVRVEAETVCNAKREGTIHYSDGTNEIEFCDGSAWSRVEGPEGKQGLAAATNGLCISWSACKPDVRQGANIMARKIPGKTFTGKDFQHVRCVFCRFH